MNKLLAGGGILAGLMALSVAVPAFAATSLGTNWRVFNVMPATAMFWDINPVKSTTSSGLTFPIQRFDTTTNGSFAVYLLNNYNVDMTGKTITASNMSWDTGSYSTRGAVSSGAYVRLEFQDTTSGPYDSNDYWWSTGANSLDMNVVPGGTLSISLTDCTLWSNQSGKSACNTTQDWQQWQGDIVHMSPADGFAKAVKNVKQVGLSFGNASSYASGVARDGGAGTFTLESFTITP